MVKQIDTIYCITQRDTGKKYIGITNDIEKRWEGHRSQLRNGKHSCKDMVEDCEKYGIDSFRIEPLAKAEHLSRDEFFYQLFYRTYDRRYGYNSNEPRIKSAMKYPHVYKMLFLGEIKDSDFYTYAYKERALRKRTNAGHDTLATIEQIYERIIDLIEFNGMTKAAFERKVGLANGAVSKWEKNYPSLATIDKIAKEFGVEFSDLIRKEN